MPLTTGGHLTIIASADLGGLGNQTGMPVEYDWVLPGVGSLLLPWMMMLGLLGIRANRNISAWWILAPLGLLLGSSLLPAFASTPLDFFADIIIALGFGLAAVWLTANFLRRSHWMLTWLCMVPMLGVFSLVVFWNRYKFEWHDVSGWQAMIMLAIAVPVCVTGLTLVGRICKQHFRPLTCGLWLLLILPALWLLLALPFFVVARLASSGNIAWSEFFAPVLCVGLGNYAVLLPFLILSGLNTLHLQRLKYLLNIEPPLLSTPETDIPLIQQPT